MMANRSVSFVVAPTRHVARSSSRRRSWSDTPLIVTEYLAPVPSALTAFIDDLAAFHDQFGPDVPALVAATEARLASLVREPGFLPSEACVGSPDRYTPHILHVAPDRSHRAASLP